MANVEFDGTRTINQIGDTTMTMNNFQLLAALAGKMDDQIEGSMHCANIRIFADGTGCISAENTSANDEETFYFRFDQLEDAGDALARQTGNSGLTLGDHLAAIVEDTGHGDPELDAAIWKHVEGAIGAIDTTNPTIIREVYPVASRSASDFTSSAAH